MKKKMVRFIAAGAAVVAFLAAPLFADDVFAEGSQLNYIRDVSEKVEIFSPFSQITKLSPQQLKVNEEKVSSLKAEDTIVETAFEYEGVPYSFGGSTPTAFDYSGYTAYVYKKAGKELPRSTVAQYASSEKISQSEAEPGDLIFFNQTGRVDHVGIYVGEGEFISAQSSKGVEVDSFATGYWSNHVVGFGRVN